MYYGEDEGGESEVTELVDSFDDGEGGRNKVPSNWDSASAASSRSWSINNIKVRNSIFTDTLNIE